MTKLLVLRGNSGSGKTTTAQCLRAQLGTKALLISQDVVRRQILHAPDAVGTSALAVLEELIRWGQEQGFTVIILEGILKRSVYGDFLGELKQEWGSAMVTVYFDVSFATTLQRNQRKARPFRVKQLEQWWLTQDSLGYEDIFFHDDETMKSRVVQLIARVGGEMC